MLTDRSINESEHGGTARQRQAGQRREQLLAAALALFAERGWAETTIRDLSTRLGVAHGLVYHYFPSKQALLWAVVERYSFLPELRQLLAVSGERPAHEVLCEVVHRFDALLTQRDGLLQLLMHSSVPELVAARRELGTEGPRLVREYLTARVAAGELRPHNLDVTARMLMAPVLMAHLAGTPTEGWLGELVPQLLQGLRAETGETGQ